MLHRLDLDVFANLSDATLIIYEEHVLTPPSALIGSECKTGGRVVGCKEPRTRSIRPHIKVI